MGDQTQEWNVKKTIVLLMNKYWAGVRWENVVASLYLERKTAMEY